MGKNSGVTREASTPRSAQAPHSSLNDKRRGEWAELTFTCKAVGLGFGVSKPYGDSLPYDFLLQHGKRLLRIQVKSVFVMPAGGRRFGVRVCQRKSHGTVCYSEDEVDFIAAYVAPHDAWYLIPVKALGNRKSVRLYPTGRRRRRAPGWFECYREAWGLLEEGG